MSEEIIITTGENIPGYEIEKIIGIVHASTARARSIIRDISAGIKNIIGGKIKEYEELMDQAREEVLEKIKEKAKAMGADAVICLRFSTSAIAQGIAEIYAYGTAVKLKKK